MSKVASTVLSGLPVRLDGESLKALLLHAAHLDVSDVTVQTDEPVMAELHNDYVPLMKRSLTDHEVGDLTNFIYGPNGVARIKQGEDIDCSYEIHERRAYRHRFRINITGCQSRGGDGIQITIRLIKAIPPKLADLHVEQAILDNIMPHDGLIVITGATGSGKSTLLASVIGSIVENPNSNKKIITYEAPIEYVYDEIEKQSCVVSQHEIPRHLPSFARGIRNSLRRAPKIILVGESRDNETIQAALEASETGHLLYTTVHTNSVPEALYRMVNMFSPQERLTKMYEIIEALRLIVTQRLVKTIDGKRTALREYLVFSQEVRDRLRQTQALKEAVALVAEFVESQGQSMQAAAMKALDEGRIDKREAAVFENYSRAHSEEFLDL